MPIQYRDVSAMGSGTTSLVLTSPATVQVNDVLVAFIVDAATTGNAPTPSGWTFQTGYVGSIGRTTIFYAIVDGVTITASQVTTWSGLTGHCIGAMVAYSGCTSTPIDASGLRNNTSPTTGHPGITTQSFGDYIVACFASYQNGSTWSGYNCATNPTTLTERIDAANGTIQSIAIADAPRNPPGTGATGFTNATMATPANNSCAVVGLQAAPLAPNSTTDNVTPVDIASIISLAQFRDVGAIGSGTGTTLTLTTPARAQNGDVLLAYTGDKGTSSSSTAAPSGWTRQNGGATAGSGGRIQVFSAIVGQGGVTANQSVTWTGLVTASIGVIAAYSGVDNVNPFEGGSAFTHASGSTGTITANSTTWGALVAAASVSFSNNSTWSGQAFNTNPTAAYIKLRTSGATATPMSIDLVDGLRQPRAAGATGAYVITMGTPGGNGSISMIMRSNNVGSSADLLTSGYTPNNTALYPGGTTDGITSADAISGGLLLMGGTTDGLTSADAANTPALIGSGSTTSGVAGGTAASSAGVLVGNTTSVLTSGYTASSRLLAVGSTTDGVTAGYVASGALINGRSTTDGVTTSFTSSATVTSGSQTYVCSTADSTTAAFAATSKMVASGNTTTSGITAAFAANNTKSFAASNTTDNITSGFVTSGNLITSRSTTSGVVVGYTTAGAFTAQGSTTSSIASGYTASISSTVYNISTIDSITSDFYIESDGSNLVATGSTIDGVTTNFISAFPTFGTLKRTTVFPTISTIAARVNVSIVTDPTVNPVAQFFSKLTSTAKANASKLFPTAILKDTFITIREEVLGYGIGPYGTMPYGD